MQQIIDFIIRKKDVVVYLILLLFSLLLIINSNYFHKSKILLFSNSITNISNNLSSFKNHLIINKGADDGLKNEMGIINSTGIVGIINRTSKNYSSVMSILNIETKINAKVKRTSHFGTLEWDGLSNSYLLLNDIPETADIKVGDSLIFPDGINVGVVSEIINTNKYNDSLLRLNNNNGKYLDLGFRENYLNIEVKLHTNMNNLNNVYVIESLNREEFKNISK